MVMECPQNQFGITPSLVHPVDCDEEHTATFALTTSHLGGALIVGIRVNVPLGWRR